MRTKNFLVFLGCVCITSVLLVLLGPQRGESLNQIVSQTHQQIRSIQDNLNYVQEKNLSADSNLLSYLGFSTSTNTITSYNGSWASNTTKPTVVSYVLRHQLAQAIGLARNIMSRWHRQSLIIYDIGLSNDDLLTLSTFCNSSRCTIYSLLNLEQFPSYVQQEHGHAFRPIIIQDALTKCGSVIYLESNRRVNCTWKQFSKYYDKVRKSESGILGWSTKHAVSSLTHPKMFEYFRTLNDNFLFLPMMSANPLVIVNSEKIQKEVMLPWVQCTLTQDCIYPIGAQSGGCRFDKKPLYRYSGCHSYDTSALNIVLGLRHGLNETHYSMKTEISLTIPEESDEDAERAYRLLNKNATALTETGETSAVN
ncbi:uncharacterized protein LOC113389322 [Ctenocephalides felis]|uniref:uncharacterized protein LOC113389322 n=1 Tax=Ctenocephalides felis TaxID=7515 RepID=UPI000E6E2A1F|nr:uncharacterized protein LOC113389322 [Ctenocephalides felis]